MVAVFKTAIPVQLESDNHINHGDIDSDNYATTQVMFVL